MRTRRGVRGDRGDRARISWDQESAGDSAIESGELRVVGAGRLMQVAIRCLRRRNEAISTRVSLVGWGRGVFAALGPEPVAALRLIVRVLDHVVEVGDGARALAVDERPGGAVA